MYRVGETGIVVNGFDLRYAGVTPRQPWEGWDFETGEIITARSWASLNKKVRSIKR